MREGKCSFGTELLTLKCKYQEEEETRETGAPSGKVCEMCGWFDSDKDLAARVRLFETSGKL